MSISLQNNLEEIFRLNYHQKTALLKLGLKTVENLLFHFPARYEGLVETKTIKNLEVGLETTIYGKISKLKLSKGFKTKIPMAEGLIDDGSGTIKAVWFNQPYIAKMIKEGAFIRASGKVLERKGKKYIANPKIEGVENLPISSKESLFAKEEKLFAFPVYGESRGITSRWFYYAIQKILKSGVLDEIADPIPQALLKKYNLPSLKTALIWVHTPKRELDTIAARKRFAFEEVFFIQLIKQREKRQYESKKTFIIEPPEIEINSFIKRFPFEATGAQKNAVETILKDFKSGQPMSRLLEGDVGSGKTAVAATTSFAAISTRPSGQDFGTLQVAYMAPTEILGTQHFESFIQYFRHLPINIALLTGTSCRKFPSKVNPNGWTDISRNQLLKWVAGGEIAILIGTHALIQKTVRFKNLGYIIIDEQHRFGVSQRQKLAKKEGFLPHLLSMTATPIPRTLALTIYGDLDLTLLDEMPAGRKPIITEIINQDQRGQLYEKIRKELQNGRQAYVICPRIDEPDPSKALAILAKSVKEEAKRLKKNVFKEFNVEILHSKMKPKEKDAVMSKFKNHEIDILVATSVVEVGVNVPNATVILIEGAERFGLAQLHQLRGRVIRSNHQAHCFVLSESGGEKSMGRLKALTKAKNGFELAELDLGLRGAGELYGNKQWGLTDVGMEAMKNIKMVEAARLEAKNLLEADPNFEKNPVIKERIKIREAELHLE